MQVHIQEALDQVNQIVKKLFQPNNELKKTIYVLDQPPDPFIWKRYVNMFHEFLKKNSWN